MENFGTIDLFEMTSDLPLVKKLPTWGRPPPDLLGNLVWVEDLFVTNRARLQTRVQKALAVSQPAGEPSLRTRRLPYKQVDIPGDGRCGWRAILACRNIKQYEAVPRPGIIRNPHNR